MAVDSFTYAGDADGMMEMLCKVVNFASVWTGPWAVGQDVEKPVWHMKQIVRVSNMTWRTQQFSGHAKKKKKSGWRLSVCSGVDHCGINLVSSMVDHHFPHV